jgi:pyruvate,water dikinase
MTRFVLGPWSTADELRADGGGKAVRLFELEARGYAVPAWICIGAGALDLARVSGMVPPDLSCALRAGLARVGIGGAEAVAVRSSGLEEDSAERSFAGQFESFLFQRGEAQILDAIRRCWASASSARVAAYRKQAGLNGTPVRMGVIIQRMIDAESAGVVFSRDPLRVSQRSKIVVESVWGLGEGLVSGALDPDRHRIDRQTLAVNTVVSGKTHAIVADPAGGTRALPLDDRRRAASSLTDDDVRVIATMALRLERDFGGPQDAEWALAGGRCYCLQTRPITTLPPDALFAPDVAGTPAVIWDNSNIVESYAGVTTPLTFSHVSRCYREVYVQFCRLMGVPKRVVEEHEPMFRNMLGLVRGRIYYNLVNWYRLVSLFPGAGRSRRFMETMMGVKQSLSPELAALFEGVNDRPQYPLWRRVAVQVVTIYRLARIRRCIDEFMARVDRVQRPLERADLGAISLPEQVAIYRRLETEVLRYWTAPIVSDTRCMVAFGTLLDLGARWLGDAGGSLRNDLLCGGADLKSAEPTRMLVRIAEHVMAADDAVRARFLSEPPEMLWVSLAGGFAPGVRGMFDVFLQRYGFRCADELKLEEPDLNDDPRFIVLAVQSYVRLGRALSVEAEDHERSIRRAAEDRVRARLRGPRRWIYFAALRWARAAVRDRELLRFERTRMFGVTRRLFRGMGANLARLGALDEAGDVFFLTIDELIAFVEGRSLTSDYRALVAVRRREREEYMRTPAPPDRFVTRGAAAASMRYPQLLRESDLLPVAAGGPDDGVLRGTPCSPGVVEGVVRVARRLADAEGLQGEILVTERTDPGWVPLFPACSGLIIERGSLLSHSAVVAREMGIPTIVGVSGRPVDRLITGQRVRLDAGRGEVTIL